MSNRNCQFTWLKQKETLISLAESLLKDETYFDCQLCAEGHYFNVHRVILSCNSPIFHTLLQDHITDLPVITLEGVSSSVVSALLEFMYTGVTRISPSNLKNFFQTANSLKLTGLSHYDNAQIDKIINENGDQTIDSKFQQEKNYNQNILKYLDQSEKSNGSHFRNITSKNEAIFLEESTDTSDIVNEGEMHYEKYNSSFIKNDDSVESIDTCLIENNELSQNYDEVECNESIIKDTPLMYNKYHSVFIKNEDSFTDNIVTIGNVYSLSKTDSIDNKEENEFIDLQHELKVTDEDENFVYVKLYNDTVEKIKDSQSSKGKLNLFKHNTVHPFDEKHYKSIYPAATNYVVKKPKIQSEVTNNTRTNSEDKKIYICLKCGNKYSHRRTLLHHIHWICEQPATYSCSLCPYRGKRKFQLKSHMKHAHLLKLS